MQTHKGSLAYCRRMLSLTCMSVGYTVCCIHARVEVL
jgi:hypothetical protein